jgi:hypothetical protein
MPEELSLRTHRHTPTRSRLADAATPGSLSNRVRGIDVQEDDAVEPWAAAVAHRPLPEGDRTSPDGDRAVQAAGAGAVRR